MPILDLFNPTEEHVLLRQTVRNFVREQVEPQALEYDRQERFNLPLFRQLGDMGLLGITVPGVKLVAAAMAKQVADNAMQVLGGYGYTKDLTRRMDLIR